jgi:hypothetical protein
VLNRTAGDQRGEGHRRVFGLIRDLVVVRSDGGIVGEVQLAYGAKLNDGAVQLTASLVQQQ